MRIVFTGGGTLGHLFPIVAVARQFKKLYKQEDNSSSAPGDRKGKLELFYLGPKDAYSIKLLKQENVEIKNVLAGKVRRYFSIKNILTPFQVVIGCFQAFFHLFVLGPDIVISKGGYGSFPVVVCAWLLQIPVLLHESDSIAGFSAKIESKLALWVFTSFPQTKGFPQNKIIAVGNPVRENIITPCVKEQAKHCFHLQETKQPLLLVWGGSQGAQYINNAVLETITRLLENFEVIHQTGPGNFRDVKAEAFGLLGQSDLRNFYHPVPFLGEKELRLALNCCDLAVSRAGAGSIFELAAAGKPSVLIPLPSSAQDHQVKNGYIFAKAGACSLMEQKGLTPNLLMEKLRHLAERPDLYQRMGQAAKRFSKPKAAYMIAAYTLEYLKLVLED